MYSHSQMQPAHISRHVQQLTQQLKKLRACNLVALFILAHVVTNVAPLRLPDASNPEYVTEYVLPSSVMLYASAASCALLIAPARMLI